MSQTYWSRYLGGDLVVLWLDLMNAYGSIPHKLVEEALKRYHVPGKITKLILDYYNNFQITSSGIIISNWYRLERGIIIGCMLSATLFTLAINMIVKSAEIKCRSPMMKTGVQQAPIRAYMDDLTVTTTSVMGSKWILRSLEKLIVWTRMKFKPAKSRSFVMKKRTTDNFHFSIVGTMILTLLECPIKSLGKIFNITLRDTNTVRAVVGDLEL